MPTVRAPQKAETSPIQEGMGRMGKRSRRRTIQPQRKSVGEGVASTLILERSSLVGGPGKADQLMVRRYLSSLGGIICSFISAPVSYWIGVRGVFVASAIIFLLMLPLLIPTIKAYKKELQAAEDAA